MRFLPLLFLFSLSEIGHFVLFKLVIMSKLFGKIQEVVNDFSHSYYNVIKLSAFVVAIVLVFWQMPRAAKFKYEFAKSKPWQHETLYAPFDFPIYKDEEKLNAEYEEIKKSVKPIFRFDEAKIDGARESLLYDFEKQWNAGAHDKAKSQELLLGVYDTIENSGVVAYDKVMDELEPDVAVTLVRNKVARTVRLNSMFTMNTATELVQNWVASADDDVDKQLLVSLLLNNIGQNVFYDANLSKQELDLASKSVSLTYGMVQKDEVIVTEGQVIDERIYSILSSLQREYAGRDMSLAETLRMYLSQLALVILVFVVFAVYLQLLHKKEIYSELRKINMILLMMLMMIIPSYWIMTLHPSYILVMPVSILTIMMVTFFSSRVAFATQIFTILLISLSVPNPFQYIFMQIMVCSVVIYTLSTQRNARVTYFKTSFFVFLVYVFVYVAFSFLTDSVIEVSTIGLLALNALFTLLSLPLISLFERIFGFTTVLTLLELSNTNSPVLRKLATTAPGTFQHSFQVANLCEEVLYEIGGDALLARTGALYHDIGKMKNPLYFTENQRNGYNSHNDISNVESAQIIISHVLDGIEMAHEAKLPEQIIDFIRTHHGTRRTDYFYIMEQKEQGEGAYVDPTPFTYHGPEPFSRETAVLMMADSIEAASRSLKEPTEKSISDLVDNIIAKQTEAGQFNNTDLTLRDFETIKKVLKKKLMSIYHVRIAYPDK